MFLVRLDNLLYVNKWILNRDNAKKINLCHIYQIYEIRIWNIMKRSIDENFKFVNSLCSTLYYAIFTLVSV